MPLAPRMAGLSLTAEEEASIASAPVLIGVGATLSALLVVLSALGVVTHWRRRRARAEAKRLQEEVDVLRQQAPTDGPAALAPTELLPPEGEVEAQGVDEESDNDWGSSEESDNEEEKAEYEDYVAALEAERLREEAVAQREAAERDRVARVRASREAEAARTAGQAELALARRRLRSPAGAAGAGAGKGAASGHEAAPTSAPRLLPQPQPLPRPFDSPPQKAAPTSAPHLLPQPQPLPRPFDSGAGVFTPPQADAPAVQYL